MWAQGGDRGISSLLYMYRLSLSYFVTVLNISSSFFTSMLISSFPYRQIRIKQRMQRKMLPTVYYSYVLTGRSGANSCSRKLLRKSVTYRPIGSNQLMEKNASYIRYSQPNQEQSAGGEKFSLYQLLTARSGANN